MFAAIASLLAFPPRKEIWYDETVSMMISKGISHDTQYQLATTDTVSSSTLEQLNTPTHVYKATVKDMGNSFLYNIGLHWFTALFGNGIVAYTAFSKLCSVAAIIAFFALANLFLDRTVFSSLAIVLLATDLNFASLSYEIRGYSMSILFLILAGTWFYKFMYTGERPLHLFLTALFSAAAFLTHFLSVYVILVFLGALILTKKSRLLSQRNLAVTAIPTVIVATYLFFASRGLLTMAAENEAIRLKTSAGAFMLSEVLYRSMHLSALDFRIGFPAFSGTRAVIVASFLLLIALYVGARTLTVSSADRGRLDVLFALGLSGGLFLAVLSATGEHYTALQYRYHAFAVSFGCLCTAYMIRILLTSPKTTTLVRAGMLAVAVLPPAALFVTFVRDYDPVRRYEHVAIAHEIVSNGVVRLGVPEWKDALLVQALLPRGYDLGYVRRAHAADFTLYKPGADSTVRARTGS